MENVASRPQSAVAESVILPLPTALMCAIPRCQTNDSLTPNICPTCASRHSYDDFLRGLEVCGMTEHIHGDGSHTGKDIPDADRKAEMLKCVCSKILLKYY